MTAATYSGLHARYYDIVYGDKPYRKEATFVDSLLRELGIARGRVLDVACGTGRHAAEFARLGWNVTGVDLSDSLLEHARLNAPSAQFFRQDMRSLDVPGRPFDAVTCLFDSIGYPLDDEGVEATLRLARHHLRSDGALVVEFLHAPALLSNASPVRVRSFELSDEGDELVRISRTRLDERRRRIEVEFDLLELRVDGTYDRWREIQANRFFFPSEMRAFLEQAGLSTERLLPAYEGGQIDEQTFHVIAVAQAAE